MVKKVSHLVKVDTLNDALNVASTKEVVSKAKVTVVVEEVKDASEEQL